MISRENTLNNNQVEVFRNPSNRKRILLAIGFAFFGQSSGVLVLNNFGKVPQLES